MRSNRRHVLRAGVATLALPLAARASESVMRWRLANEYPATSLPGEADTFFAQRVNDAAGARLHVETVFDAKSGLRTREQLRAVGSGRIAMANSFAGALSDEHPLFLLSSLPFLTASVDDARRLYELAQPAYERIFRERNQRILYVTPWPPSGLWSAMPVSDRAALAKLRVRTYDKTGTDVFSKVSVAASVVSFADLPAKLSAKEIDAVLSSGDGGAGRRLWEQLPHFAEIQYATPLSFGTVNLDAWNGLDAQLRDLLESAGRETSARQWRAMQGRVEQNYERMRTNGMRIDRTPPRDVMEALREAAARAEAERLASAGDEGRAILAAYRR